MQPVTTATAGKEYTMQTDVPTRIGYLSGQHVLCMDCAPAAPRDMVPIYSDNIGRYSQACHQCEQWIATPANPAWPELWDRKDCRQCQQ